MRTVWLSALIVAVDQLTKLLVLRVMYPGQQVPVLGDWLKLTFTRNPGMAFGITVGPRALVTVFSIIATVLILLYLYRVRRDYYPYRASLSLILGGAIGNIIDRMFYGVWFDGDGLLLGKVVDFIHVDVWNGVVPEVLPFIGGRHVSLFPIWNVADMAIVCGVVGIIFFQKRHHQKQYEDALSAQTEVGEIEGSEGAGMESSASGRLGSGAMDDPSLDAEARDRSPDGKSTGALADERMAAQGAVRSE